MKLEEILQQLTDSFKVPETIEEAMAYVNKDPSMQALIEEMAFRQVVINVLVAANIITEKDFNESVKFFKNTITKSFAEELLSKLDDFNRQYEILKSTEETNEPEETDDWSEDPDESHMA